MGAKRTANQPLGCDISSTFHDLKAKSISDYEGSSRDTQLFSGRKTEGLVLVFDRKVKVTPTLDAPVIKKDILRTFYEPKAKRG